MRTVLHNSETFVISRIFADGGGRGRQNAAVAMTALLGALVWVVV